MKHKHSFRIWAPERINIFFTFKWYKNYLDFYKIGLVLIYLLMQVTGNARSSMLILLA